MKKLLALVISALLVLSVSACKSDDLQQNNASSKVPAETDGFEQQNDSSSQDNVTYVRSLIRALTGSDDVSNIKSLSITPYNSSAEINISNSNDWAFLEKYQYSNTISYSEKNSLIDSKKASLIKFGIPTNEIYILNDGSIIKQEMCGDSGVSQEDRNFEIYKAEEKYMLNEQKLLDLLKKYDNSISNK